MLTAATANVRNPGCAANTGKPLIIANTSN